jgi:hypothetical protein
MQRPRPVRNPKVSGLFRIACLSYPHNSSKPRATSDPILDFFQGVEIFLPMQKLHALNGSIDRIVGN